MCTPRQPTPLPSGLGGSVPLRVPQTPLPPKREEVRGPAYDMAAQATPSGHMGMTVSRAPRVFVHVMWVAVDRCVGVATRRPRLTSQTHSESTFTSV